MRSLGNQIIAALFLLSSGLFSIAAEATIVQLHIQGAIGPATADYIERSFDKAHDMQAKLIIIKMDTPGGLDTSMRDIIKTITRSNIPVATYVAPTGGRAASAGTYILYASHIAAMAPGTNVGAATPVQIGAPGMPSPTPKPTDQDKDKKPEQVPQDSAMQKKIINDAVAYIKGLAALHGRNEKWAEKAVREAASLPAKQALKLKVIDIVATDTSDLIKQLDGRKISLQGRTQTLQTAGLVLIEMEPDWRSRLLAVITNPNVAYILMLIGIYGLIFEFSNPGAMIPGVVGAICLLLALYAFQVLPINYAGVALILLGIALMVGEAFQPSFGMLGIGGVIAFVIGSIILMDTEVPGYGINISIIVTFSALSALMFIFVIGMAIKARQRPVVSGAEQLIGGTATVMADFDSDGTVVIHSETWHAHTSVPLKRGQKVYVKNIKGLTLYVEPESETI